MPEETWTGDVAPEREPPREGRWIAKPRRVRWFAYAGLVAIVPSQINLWVNLLSNGKGWPVEVLLALYALVVVAALALILRTVRQSARALRETEAMMDGNFGDQYPVDITIVVEGRPIGSDRGVLWFADDRLGFSGRASSFVLGSRDVAGGPRLVARGKITRAVPQNALILKNAPKEAYVTVAPLKRQQDYRERLHFFLPGDFRTERARLLRQNPEAVGERQWPPLVPYGEESEPAPTVLRSPETVGARAAQDGFAQGTVPSSENARTQNPPGTAEYHSAEP